MVAEHLTIKYSENPSYVESICCEFEIFGEHFKTAHGALVVPGAVVGNH